MQHAHAHHTLVVLLSEKGWLVTSFDIYLVHQTQHSKKVSGSDKGKRHGKSVWFQKSQTFFVIVEPALFHPRPMCSLRTKSTIDCFWMLTHHHATAGIQTGDVPLPPYRVACASSRRCYVAASVRTANLALHAVLGRGSVANLLQPLSYRV